MATRVTANVYHQSEAPLSRTIASFFPLSPFESPPHLTIAPFSFSYSFSRVLAERTHVRIRAECRGVRWSGLHPSYTTPRFSILFTTPVLCVVRAITRSGFAKARACRQIGGNRGRRNLSQPVTTLSDVVARGCDVRMCPLEDGGKYDRMAIL